MAFPDSDKPDGGASHEIRDELVKGESHVVSPESDEPLAETNLVLEAWRRVISRVLSVTTVMPGLEAAPELSGENGTSEPQEANEEQIGSHMPEETANPQRRGHALICLGDLMEESISWLEVDSEDDVNSPKQSDMVQATEETEEAGAEEPEVPSCLKDVYRQQNAAQQAGIAKCLSF
jgi:hypothetical protein